MLIVRFSTLHYFCTDQQDFGSNNIIITALSLLVNIDENSGHAGLWDRVSDSGARGRGFHPHSGRRVVSLSKRNVLPKSTGNTQEEVASSQHD